MHIVIGKLPSWDQRDLRMVDLLSIYCRLRYSELNDLNCVIDTGNEEASNGHTSLDHELDSEFCEMSFCFHQLQESGHIFVKDTKAYTEILTVLVKTLHSYHLLFGYKPMYKYKIAWPPTCCIGQKVQTQPEVIANLKAAVDAANVYLELGNYKDIGKKLVGNYDWISFEPLI